MQLRNPDTQIYVGQLKKIYGKPEEVDTPSETGSIRDAWNIGDIRLRLYQEYELSSLEITKMPKTSEAASDTDSRV